jgi:hypothetical protein
LKKQTWILAAIPILIAAGCIAVMQYHSSTEVQNPTAWIYQDGQEVAKIPLDGTTDGQTLTLSGEDGMVNVIEVSGKQIHMKSASCPDQICVNMGFRSQSGSPIVCLPAKIVIEIKGGTDEIDA